MSATLSDEAAGKLVRLADVLIPGDGDMPAAGALPDLPELLRTAVAACAFSETEVHLALESLDRDVDWNGAKALADARPEAFHILGTLASAAYFMAPAVLAVLKFPMQRHHPAEVEDFVTEYETGILDPVTERGQRFREVPARADVAEAAL